MINTKEDSEKLVFMHESLQTVQTQGFISIKHILSDSFKIHVSPKPEETKDGEGEKPSVTKSASMLYSKLSQGFKGKPSNSESLAKLKIHLELLSTLLYGSANYHREIKKIASSF
jgi:hypothetical protein